MTAPDHPEQTHRHILMIALTRDEAEFIEWCVNTVDGFVGLKGHEDQYESVRMKLTHAINKTYE